MKIPLIFGLTKEQVESTNAEAFVSAAMRENIAAGLDTLAFDATAADTARPAGLRAGVGGLTATSGGGLAALVGDLAQLANAVSAVGGANVVYVCHVKDWIKIRAYLPLLSLPVLPSLGIAAGTIVCVAPDALAVAGSSEPIRIERSIETVIHADTVPTALTTGSTATPVAAYPLISAFQTDVIFIKMVCEISWALRTTSGAVSWLSSLTW